MESRTEIHAEETAESLPETGAETPQESLHYGIARLVSLSVDELQEHFPLALGHVLYGRLVLLENVMFQTFEMLFPLLGVRDGLDVFIGFAKSGERHLGIRERLADIAHRAPVKLFLLLVLEFQRRKHVYVANESIAAGVAVFVNDMGETLVSLDLQTQVGHIFILGGGAKKGCQTQRHRQYPKECRRHRSEYFRVESHDMQGEEWCLYQNGKSGLKLTKNR